MVPPKKVETQRARIPVTPSTFKKVAEFRAAAGISNEDFVRICINVLIRPGETVRSAGERLRNELDTVAQSKAIEAYHVD